MDKGGIVQLQTDLSPLNAQVPDREIAQLEEDCAKKGLPVKVNKNSFEFTKYKFIPFLEIS